MEKCQVANLTQFWQDCVKYLCMSLMTSICIMQFAGIVSQYFRTPLPVGPANKVRTAQASGGGTGWKYGSTFVPDGRACILDAHASVPHLPPGWDTHAPAWKRRRISHRSPRLGDA